MANMRGPLEEATTQLQKRPKRRSVSVRPQTSGASKQAAGPAADLNVVVLGMHRSGTSAVAEALRAAGFNAGPAEGLMVPEPQNPAGFGELLSVAHFNDRLLGSLEWFWDAPDAAPPVNPPARSEFVAEGLAMVEKYLAGPHPFVLKDPRISLLLPWWRRILFDRFVPIVVMRDPVEVAWSLRVRDGFPMELGLAIYAAYHRHLAAGLDGLTWIGVDFDALCDRPRLTLNRVLRELSRLGVVTGVDTHAGVRAIRPLLRRTTHPEYAPLGPDLIPALDDIRQQSPAEGVSVATRFERIAPPSGWETAILDAHRRAREAGARNEVARENVRQLESSSARVRGELADAMRDRDATRAALVDREAQLVALDARHAEQTARLEARTLENADHVRMEAELRAQLENTERERDVARASVADLEVRVASTTAEHSQLRTRLASATADRAQLEAQLVALDARHAEQTARLEARTLENADHVRTEAELRAQLENAERERDVARASVARRRAFHSMSPRSMARGVRARYRRAVVRLPPTLVGLVWHNPLFDAGWYLEQNPDVRGTRLGPEAHFRRHGAAERRRPNRLFDMVWYLEHNPDVAASRINPLDHYLLFGADEDRSPSPAFDTAWYMAANPDVAASGMNPLLHYLCYGRLEGRSPTPKGTVSSPELAPARSPVMADRPARREAEPRPIPSNGAGLFPRPPRVRADVSNGRRLEVSGVREVQAAYGAAEETQLADDIRLVAFYRSTYYADVLAPNGDDSDWLTVAKARPTLAGQRQPHVPRDLGFYDLRLAETRRDQAELARQYGIHAFCYDETWGLPDLYTRPFREMLRSGEPEFRFTLRMTLDPASSAPRVVSRLSTEWLAANLAQLTSALEALADPRAVRVGNDPVFVVEGIGGDDATRAAEVIREQARRVGLPGIFIVAPVTSGSQPESAGVLGVDALLEAHPDPALVAGSRREARRRRARSTSVATYDDYARRAKAMASGPDRIPGVLVAWDDTPLDGRGWLILTDATPESYGAWLRSAVATARDSLAPERRFVFVASWNDWARGAHLEPDVASGRAYLETTRARLVAPVLNVPEN